jgi:uncharacterized protein (TIGR00251 family)
MTVQVKVTPSSSKNEICGLKDGVLKIKIAAPPEDGKANTELIHFLAKHYGVRKKDVQLIKGKKSRNKTLEIHNTQ